MINAVLGKTMENVRKHGYVKLVTTGKRRNYVLLKANFRITKFFAETLFEIEMKKTKILMNKPVFLGFSILELRKMLMYEYSYGYIKPKYGEKA